MERYCLNLIITGLAKAVQHDQGPTTKASAAVRVKTQLTPDQKLQTYRKSPWSKEPSRTQDLQP